MKPIAIIIMLLLGGTLMAGCAATRAPDGASDEPAGSAASGADACLMAPDIVGIVREIREDGAAILVDSDTETVKGLIWVTITGTTDFFEDTDPDSSIGLHDVSRDFSVGNRVAIVSDGGIMESYPMQTRAAAVYENAAP